MSRSRFSTHPYVHQINVSNGGVPKHPVPEARITVDGVAGDCQRSPKIHGGPDRAVCLFSLEVIEALRAEGHSIAPGSSGENLTLAGLDSSQATGWASGRLSGWKWSATPRRAKTTPPGSKMGISRAFPTNGTPVGAGSTHACSPRAS